MTTVNVSNDVLLKKGVAWAEKKLLVNALNRKKVLRVIRCFCKSSLEAQLLVASILEEKRVASAERFMAENEGRSFDYVFNALNELFRKPGAASVPTITERVMVLAMN